MRERQGRPPSAANLGRMQYRTLGRTGLRVSAIGFGGAPIGIPGYLGRGDRDDPGVRAEALAAIRSAVKQGITYFDTAPGYGGGRSEHLIGEALDGLRAQVLVATKFTVGAEPTDGLCASLERLRTGHVDVLQLHGSVFDDAEAHRVLDSGVLDWAEEMRGKGRCRFIGITAEGPSGGLERLLGSGRFDVLQVAYNVIYQSVCDYQREPAGVIPLARRLGMGVVTMRTATSGFLPRLLAAEFPGLDPARVARLAIRFVLSTPEVDCALVGMRTVVEVQANAALAADPTARLDLRALHDRFAE